jgi:hypothetical protein
MVVRGRLRRVLCWAWVFLAGLLALIAAIDLVSSIANAHYDAHENRSPLALVVLAGLGAATAAGALGSALSSALGRRTPLGPPLGLALTGATLVLIPLLWLLAFASGPH